MITNWIGALITGVSFFFNLFNSIVGVTNLTHGILYLHLLPFGVINVNNL